MLLENFRPGVMERLGLGLDALRARNAGLIYCSITGFGEGGPYRDRPAYDAVAQSLSGVCSMFIEPEDPQITGPTIADNMTGINACYGILGALFERERTGKARRVDVNMLESTITFMPDPWSNLIQGGFPQGPHARVRASQSYSLRCSDGKLLALHLSSPQKFWQGVQNAFARPDLGADERFAARESRIENYFALKAEFQKTVGTGTRAHWMARLEAEDVPFAPILTLPEVREDPQVRHLETFFETAHPSEGGDDPVAPAGALRRLARRPADGAAAAARRAHRRHPGRARLRRSRHRPAAPRRGGVAGVPRYGPFGTYSG